MFSKNLLALLSVFLGLRTGKDIRFNTICRGATMKKIYGLLVLVVCGCATMNTYNYPESYKEYYYTFTKDHTTTTSVGSEMMLWGEKGTEVKPLIGEYVSYDYSNSLSYAGIAGNVLRIYYREYSNDYARPAFIQELTYTLAKDSIICFRDNRIGILEANNRNISFIVFDSPAFKHKSGTRISFTPDTPDKKYNPTYSDTSTDIFRPGSGSRKKQ